MANYDSGVTYDSGIFYDQTAAPPTTKKTMAKAKLGLKNQPDAQVIQMCTALKAGLTGNAAFPSPTPTLTAFGTLITTAQSLLTADDTAQAAAKGTTAAKNVGMNNLKLGAKSLVDYINLTAAGNPTAILSTGLSLASAATPVGPMTQVMGLNITTGDNSGELDLQWDSMPGANSYQIQMSPDPVTATSWVDRTPVTKSKAAELGLTSGAKMWARVRAIGAAGEGPWSDPATKFVP